MPSPERPVGLKDCGGAIDPLPELPKGYAWLPHEYNGGGDGRYGYWYYITAPEKSYPVSKYWLCRDPNGGVWIGPMGSKSVGHWYETPEEAVAVWAAKIRLEVYEDAKDAGGS